MPKGTCTVEGCAAPHLALGLCRVHYDLRRREMRPKRPRVRPTPAERFWAKVDKTDTCWIWTASTDPGGYGCFQVDGRSVKAHRWAFEILVGPIPFGLHIDHLCRVRSCVNPDHLEPVTVAENVNRGLRGKPQVTQCPQGHPYAGDNLYEYAGRRYCRRCKRAHWRGWAASRVVV